MAQAGGLRERGIYRLPDGQEVVVSACGGEEYCMFASATYDSFGLAEYLVSGEGLIFRGTEWTGWGVEDLADTGRTARYHVLGHAPSRAAPPRAEKCGRSAYLLQRRAGGVTPDATAVAGLYAPHGVRAKRVALLNS